MEMTTQQDAYTVDEFIRRYPMSRAHLYNLWGQGLGPRIMRCGRKILISTEAAKEWREKLEAQAS